MTGNRWKLKNKQKGLLKCKGLFLNKSMVMHWWHVCNKYQINVSNRKKKI